MNVHLGMELGKRDSWRFFFHGGGSFLNMNVKDFQKLTDSKDVSVADPKVKIWLAPTAKFGLIIYF